MRNCLFIALAFASVFSANGQADIEEDKTFPLISGDTSSSECVDALHLATAMFKSKSKRLYAPLNIPEGMDSILVLGASEIDISGGNALLANEEAFEEVSDFPPRHHYWAKPVHFNKRLVLMDSPFSWQGNKYSLYVLDAQITQDQYLSRLQDSPNGKTKYSSLIEDAWRPPLIFQQKGAQKLWVIVVGEPFEALADWAVYKQSLSGSFERECVIAFTPKIDLSTVLPLTIQHFANLLDKTLGSGMNEGNLQPTARQRANVKHVWANVALRPWALSESDTYNSTEEVMAGLKTWSQAAPSNRNAYQEILELYPIAEKELSYYYAQHFSLPKPKANRMAKWVLDITFRSYYVFPNGAEYFRYDKVNTNPWELLNFP